MITKIFYLVIGGAAGTVSRYALSGATYRFWGAAFPYGTLAVNLSGCFLIGFFAAISEKKFLLDIDGRLLLMAGFCGAFTTFSTFMLETDNLLKEGQILLAVSNVVLSFIAGFILFRVGSLLGEVI